jgi:hypothetical protein
MQVKDRAVAQAEHRLRRLMARSEDRMNHHSRKILHAIFARPVSANLDPRAVLHVFEELGAEVSRGGHGQVKISFAGRTRGFPEVRHSLPKDEVLEMRRLLQDGGVDPGRDYPL